MKPSYMSKAARAASTTALCMASFLCFAQQEQWLEYHTGTDSRGYTWIELSSKAPEGAALPNIGQDALFGRWKNALEKSDGRLICIQRTVKEGSFDTLYIDSNGNGKLDDEKPMKTAQRSLSGGYFGPVKMTFKGEDGSISYHLMLRHYKTSSSEEGQLLASSACWYEGNVSFAGKKHRVQLIDTTLNGAFNDMGAGPSQCDSISIGGTQGTQVFLGELVEVDKQLWNIEVAKDGAFIKVQKAENVATGTVNVSEEVASFSAVGKRGHFTRKPVKGVATLPVGTYRLQHYTMQRKDSKQAEWKLSGNGFGKEAEFAVSSADPVRLGIGEPIEAFLEATESKSRISFSLKMVGPMGESVDIMKGTQRPRAPQLLVTSATGNFKSTNTFEYG